MHRVYAVLHPLQFLNVSFSLYLNFRSFIIKQITDRMSSNSTVLSTEDDFHHTPSLFTGITVVVIDGTISITGTLGNLLVLTVIFVQIRFSTVSNILIANLAAVDLLTASVLIPGDIYRHVCDRMGFCHVHHTFVLLHRMLAQYLVTAAAMSLVVIALERFIAIAFPFRYRTVFTRLRAKCCVALSWLSGVLITGVFFGLKMVYVQNVLVIFLVLLTFFLYTYIFSIALKHERKIAATYAQHPDLQRSSSLRMPWERKSAKTMAIVLGVYMLCWVPSVVFYSVVRTDDWIYPRMQFWINSVYYMNAVLNPFIYGVRSEKFRKEVKRLIKSCRKNKLCPK